MSGIGGSTFVLTNSDLSVAQPLPAAAELVSVFANLGTAGSTQSTFQVNRNAVAVTGAVATIAAGQTKGNKTISNPYVGVNAGNQAGWTDQSVSGGNAVPYTASQGGVNNVAALATYAAGDTVSLTTTLGTTAANPGVTLVFKTL
jgi:hypothetical protein